MLKAPRAGSIKWDRVDSPSKFSKSPSGSSRDRGSSIAVLKARITSPVTRPEKMPKIANWGKASMLARLRLKPLSVYTGESLFFMPLENRDYFVYAGVYENSGQRTCEYTPTRLQSLMTTRSRVPSGSPGGPF